jgi:hypothetical protein
VLSGSMGVCSLVVCPDGCELVRVSGRGVLGRDSLWLLMLKLRGVTAGRWCDALPPIDPERRLCVGEVYERVRMLCVT